VATAADPTVFRSGDDFAAWIGLVPSQDSTGQAEAQGGEVGGASFHALLTRST
jgi:transposase